MEREPDKRRKFTRIRFERLANIAFAENSYEGCKISNLSISGMFIAGNFHESVGEECHIDLVQTGTSASLTLQASARVVRITDEGLAVEFVAMAFDSYMFLQTTLLYEVDDPLSIVNDFPDKSPFIIADQL